MPISDEQTKPRPDAEYEVMRQKVVNEYDSAFYGGIGRVALEVEKPALFEPIGPWIGM